MRLTPLFLIFYVNLLCVQYLTQHHFLQSFIFNILRKEGGGGGVPRPLR